MTKRLAIVLTSIVTGTVLVAALIVVLALNSVNASVREQTYRECVGTGTTQELVDNAARCHSGIYGD